MIPRVVVENEAGQATVVAYCETAEERSTFAAAWAAQESQASVSRRVDGSRPGQWRPPAGRSRWEPSTSGG